MAKTPDDLRETPSQTAGPYLHIGLAPSAAGFAAFEHEIGQVIAGPNTQGQRVRVRGQVFDGAGAVVKDAMIEVWQANGQGRYNHPEDTRNIETEPDFKGWGRVMSDLETGLYEIETIKPGQVPTPHGPNQAPHLSLWLAARGINLGLSTRMYFSDEAEANAVDPLMAQINTPARRQTLIGVRHAEIPLYRFDIRLQGPDETVFLDI